MRNPASEPRSRRVSMCLAAAVAATAWLAGSCGLASDEVPNGPPEVAPSFELAMLGTDATVGLATLAGKIVIIDFWATWCAPCEFQVPELNAFREAHRSEPDVVLFGVSVDTEGPDVVAAWASEMGVRYPILLGGYPVALEYRAKGFPTVVVIRPDGTIDSRHVGLIQKTQLEEILARIRANAPTQEPSS